MTREQALIEFLKDEQQKFEDAAVDEAQANGNTAKFERLNSKASVLSTMIRYVERGDHLIGRDVE